MLSEETIAALKVYMEHNIYGQRSDFRRLGSDCSSTYSEFLKSLGLDKTTCSAGVTVLQHIRSFK